MSPGLREKRASSLCSVGRVEPGPHSINTGPPGPMTRKAAMASAAALNVGLLKEPLAQPARQALANLRTEVDDFQVNGRELYWICLKRQSESRISNAVFERTLKVKATFRGMRTMEKLAAKYGV